MVAGRYGLCHIRQNGIIWQSAFIVLPWYLDRAIDKRLASALNKNPALRHAIQFVQNEILDESSPNLDAKASARLINQYKADRC